MVEPVRFSTTLVCCAVACGVALAACSSPEPAPAPAQQTVSLPVDAPKITLVSPGTDPRVITFNDVAEHTVPLRVSSGFVQHVAEVPEVPESAEGAGDSEFTSEVSVTGEQTNPTLRFEQLAEDYASADGFSMHWERATNGQITSVKFGAPTDADNQARAAVEDNALKLLGLPIVFPTEAIGEGGQWRVDNRIAGESAMLQTTTYTVTSLSDARVELDVSIEQRPTIGAIPGSNGGPELRVWSSRTNSTGHVSIDLDKALPTSGSVAYTTRVIYGGDDSPTRVAQDSSTKLVFGS